MRYPLQFYIMRYQLQFYNALSVRKSLDSSEAGPGIRVRQIRKRKVRGGKSSGESLVVMSLVLVRPEVRLMPHSGISNVLFAGEPFFLAHDSTSSENQTVNDKQSVFAIMMQ